MNQLDQIFQPEPVIVYLDDAAFPVSALALIEATGVGESKPLTIIVLSDGLGGTRLYSATPVEVVIERVRAARAIEAASNAAITKAAAMILHGLASLAEARRPAPTPGPDASQASATL